LHIDDTLQTAVWGTYELRYQIVVQHKMHRDCLYWSSSVRR